MTGVKYSAAAAEHMPVREAKRSLGDVVKAIAEGRTPDWIPKKVLTWHGEPVAAIVHLEILSLAQGLMVPESTARTIIAATLGAVQWMPRDGMTEDEVTEIILETLRDKKVGPDAVNGTP